MGTALVRPRAILFDYGGTLVEELEYNPRAGIEALLARAVYRETPVSVDTVLQRAERISAEIVERRDRFQIEAPWGSLTRLIHDHFGTCFDEPLAELELAFWNASVRTRAMPGAEAALRESHRLGYPMGVVSNSSFGQRVIRHELGKHGLADHLATIVVSAEYVVRKPNPLLFEMGASLLGADPADVWFVGDRLDTDIKGARSAGMTAIWYAPNQEERSDDAHHIARGWSSFVDLLRAAVGSA